MDLSFIGDAGRGLIETFPRRTIVDTTQAAVIWKMGKSPVRVGPGVVWWWPLVDTFAEIEIKKTTIDICKQAIEMEDGNIVAVSGWITYEVTNPFEALTEFTDFTETLQESAAGVISEVIWELNMPSLEVLQSSMKERLEERFGKIINVIDFSVSDYFKVKHTLLQWQP